MGKINFSNSILEKGIVIDASHKNTVRVQMSDGSVKDIPAYSPKSSGHKDHLKEGEAVILGFIKNQFERTSLGVRQHVLKTIFYPHDEGYSTVLEIEKDPSSKTECRAEMAFQKMKEKRTLKN